MKRTTERLLMLEGFEPTSNGKEFTIQRPKEFHDMRTHSALINNHNIKCKQKLGSQIVDRDLCIDERTNERTTGEISANIINYY